MKTLLLVLGLVGLIYAALTRSPPKPTTAPVIVACQQSGC